MVVDCKPVEAMKVALAIIKGVAIAVVVIVVTGCSLTLRPDGSRTYSTEPESFLRAIQIIAEK